ncbi:MAG: nitrilase-related carbon-nitrogen hydrolase, partial [Oscillospiraceae bacterium]
MRVCAVQPDTAWEDKKANMSHCQRLAMQAAGKCDLLVFPELTLTSFSMNPELAEPPDGETAEFFRKLSLDAGAAVAFGFAARTEGGIFNRLCVADGGEVIASYDKI